MSESKIVSPVAENYKKHLKRNKNKSLWLEGIPHFMLIPDEGEDGEITFDRFKRVKYIS